MHISDFGSNRLQRLRGVKINLFSVCDGPEGESLKSNVSILFMWHYKVLKISLTPLMHAIYQENGLYGLGIYTHDYRGGNRLYI